MPSDIQFHRQVPLSNALNLRRNKGSSAWIIPKVWNHDLKSDNDIGQMDLIEMHIAARPDSTPVAGQPYPLALKHHDFLKQEIDNLQDADIIFQSMPHGQAPL